MVVVLGKKKENSFYKLIFVVLVFKAKKQKTNFLVTALCPLGRAMPTYEDIAA